MHSRDTTEAYLPHLHIIINPCNLTSIASYIITSCLQQIEYYLFDIIVNTCKISEKITHLIILQSYIHKTVEQT
jgi:hypothetical protein